MKTLVSLNLLKYFSFNNYSDLGIWEADDIDNVIIIADLFDCRVFVLEVCNLNCFDVVVLMGSVLFLYIILIEEFFM